MNKGKFLQIGCSNDEQVSMRSLIENRTNPPLRIGTYRV